MKIENNDSCISDGQQLSSTDKKKQWYVVQAYSGFELFVKASLEEYVKLHRLEHKFGDILVPTEEVVEMKAGQKRRSERKFFPGYVLVNMVMDDETWYIIKKLPKVVGFIGGTSEKPAPLSQKDTDAILAQVQGGADKPKPKVLFEVGEVLRIIDGPFLDFNGVVEQVDYEKSRVWLAVSIFSRSTPVELKFGQVEKA